MEAPLTEKRITAMTVPGTTLQWRRTNVPVRSTRTDDIYFLDADRGWAVNSNGQILRTVNGGNQWEIQRQVRGVYLRCVGFANALRGWVGTLEPDPRLFETRDGGVTWTEVTNLPPNPQGVCGLSVVNERVIYGSGTNFPERSPGV